MGLRACSAVRLKQVYTTSTVQQNGQIIGLAVSYMLCLFVHACARAGGIVHAVKCEYVDLVMSPQDSGKQTLA
jgi:hypothetical protein